MRRRWSRAGAGLLLAVAAALASGPPAAGAERRVAVYAPRSCTADELLPLARTAMAGEGEVGLDPHGGSLVLIGDPAAVAQALELLADRDRAPRSVVLRFDTKREAELVERGFEVRWTAVAGDFRVGNLRVGPRSDSSLDVRARELVEQLVDSFSGTLRVTEGQRARIETGTSVPYATTRDGDPGTEFVTAGTGAEARARILGDGRVQVDLAAFADRFGRRGRVHTTRASSLVVAEPGQTLVVAGLGRESERTREDLGRGASASRLQDETLLLLRVDVE